ncbi:MAG TPA: hypothetical protein VMT00_15530 [Thermoanaerobaculia bacterium]|nr:hypothetical protein [Thermoanaerobaculia bacterium]
MAALLGVSVILIAALIPLWGVRIPPLIDFAEHLAVSKMFYEWLSGQSALPVEATPFIGYKLFYLIAVASIAIARLFAIDPLWIPLISLLISWLFIATMTILAARQAITTFSTRHSTLLLMVLVAVVPAMHNRVYFAGFMSYVVALPIVFLMVFKLEEMIRTPLTRRHVVVWVLLIAFSYVAHPFAIVLALLWTAVRGVVNVTFRRQLAEVERFTWILLGFAPIVFYHFVFWRNTPFEVPLFLGRIRVFRPFGEWWEEGAVAFFNAGFMRLADHQETVWFGTAMVVAALAATVAVAVRARDRVQLVQYWITFWLFFVLATFFHESLFPIPPTYWLDYPPRVSSLALPLAIFGAWLSYSAWNLRDRSPWVDRLLAVGVLAAVILHMAGVRRNFVHFDSIARPVVLGFRTGPLPTAEELPVLHGAVYHPDGRFILHYACLFRRDYLPRGEWFERQNGIGVLPLRLKPETRN